MNLLQERELRRYVALGSGLLANPDTPDESYSNVLKLEKDILRPTVPYATVFVAEETELSYPDDYGRQEGADGTITYTLHVPTRAAVDVMFYRTGASETARRFREWTKTNTGLEYGDIRRDSFKYGFRLQHPVGDVITYEAVVNAQREQQALLRLTLDYVDLVTETVVTVSRIEGTVRNEYDQKPFQAPRA